MIKELIETAGLLVLLVVVSVVFLPSLAFIWLMEKVDK